MAALAQPHVGSPTQTASWERFTFTQYHMGIDARIVLYAPSSEVAEAAGTAAFERIAQLEDVMSDYRPSSELMRLCAQAGGAPVAVSPDLFKVLERAQQVSQRSGGAFDVTVGPLVQLWRQARRSGKLPDPEAVRQAQGLVGWRLIRLDRRSQTVRLATPGMRLDLGGIAKGYAGDEALRALRANGVRSALIELGGDIVLGAAPPGTRGWRIAAPNAGGDLWLKDCAVSSSGDTEQFVVIGNVRYSHVVDPKTGRGLTTRRQATVIAKNGLTSDPLSTAMTVTDDRSRCRLIQRTPGLTVYLKVAGG